MSKKKKTCCSLPNLGKFPTCSDASIKQNEIIFQNGKMYKNGEYQGDVEEDEEGLFVLIKSGNRYLNGQKIRIVFSNFKD